MKRVLLASLSIATLLHVSSSFAAGAAADYDFKVVDWPGASQTILFAVNDFDQKVGEYIDAANATHAILVEGQRFLPVDPSGAIGKSASSHAYSVNALGNIAGSYADASGVLHGYVLRGGAISPVEYPNGLPTEAYGINDLGQVIGVYYTTDGNLHAFELTDGVYKAEDVPGSLTTVPLSINDRGEIVGYYLTVAGTYGEGYVRDAQGHFTTYDAPGAAPDSSFLISVNNVGETLGGSFDASGNADNLLLVGGRSEALVLPASFGAGYQSFQTINDLGEIVGFFNDAAGLAHGFVAVPKGL